MVENRVFDLHPSTSHFRRGQEVSFAAAADVLASSIAGIGALLVSLRAFKTFPTYLVGRNFQIFPGSGHQQCWR